MHQNVTAILLLLLATLLPLLNSTFAAKPHIILVMTDDQGWGQTSYNGHPLLKTPHLDAMAQNGLRFNRFYAGCAVCSPTRASVLTGRCNDRTGVPSHGHPLRLQEKTIGEALKKAGYATGHFGKWHLNGIRGPGVPLLKEDTHTPGAFGFDEWLTVSNFFDTDPIMSRRGKFEEFSGDSSEIIVAEALKFIRKQSNAGKPTFSVIWYGTPHNPFFASEEDAKPFAKLDKNSMLHYAELRAMDRSIGTLRKSLRTFGIAENTLIWFNSDNGGLSGIKPETVGGLRGNKGSIYEGGLRVPGVIEWPAGIKQPRITDFPAVTMDIFPTIADIVGLPNASMQPPIDGISLAPLFRRELASREKPIPFRFGQRAALIDNQYKLIQSNLGKPELELYDLSKDAKESVDISDRAPEVFARLKIIHEQAQASIDASIAGKDYPEGKVNAENPPSRFWMDMKEYAPYFEAWKKRKEYAGRLSKRSGGKKKKK